MVSVAVVSVGGWVVSVAVVSVGGWGAVLGTF